MRGEKIFPFESKFSEQYSFETCACHRPSHGARVIGLNRTKVQDLGLVWSVEI